jgi:hypothetical protein
MKKSLRNTRRNLVNPVDVFTKNNASAEVTRSDIQLWLHEDGRIKKVERAVCCTVCRCLKGKLFSFSWTTSKIHGRCEKQVTLKTENAKPKPLIIKERERERGHPSDSNWSLTTGFLVRLRHKKMGHGLWKKELIYCKTQLRDIHKRERRKETFPFIFLSPKKKRDLFHLHLSSLISIRLLHKTWTLTQFHLLNLSLCWKVRCERDSEQKEVNHSWFDEIFFLIK